MLYIKPFSKPAMKSKSAGFSLVEILMTLFVVALIIIGVATIITRKAGSRQTEGIVYTYNGSDVIKANGRDFENLSDVKCWVTVPHEQSNKKQYKYEYKKASSSVDKLTLANLDFLPAKDCSRYEFTVPEGVHSVNLTLVAGGGGGGGAAGGYLFEGKIHSYSTGHPLSFINEDEVRDLKINYLVGRGENGHTVAYNHYSKDDAGEKPLDPEERITSSKNETLRYEFFNNEFRQNVLTYSSEDNYRYLVKLVRGIGGKSSMALYNHNVPNEILRYKHQNQELTGGTPAHVMYSATKTNPAGFHFGKTNGSFFDYNVSYNGIACCKGSRCQYTTDSEGNRVLDDSKNNYCTELIPKQNVFDSVPGKDQTRTIALMGNYHAVLNDVVLSNQYNFGDFKGGEGGHLPMYPNYGYGGTGQGVKALYKDENYKNGNWGTIASNKMETPCDMVAEVLCQKDNGNKACNAAQLQAYESSHRDNIENQHNLCTNYYTFNLTRAKIIYGFDFPAEDSASGWNKSGGSSFGIATYVFERPGGIGGGGSGGTYVQIKNFRVNPGERYIIRVGKGGAGGAAGKYGTQKEKVPIQPDKGWLIAQDAVVGQDGIGGTSTSIWKLDGTQERLLYAVMGGTGGQGGQKYDGNNSVTYKELAEGRENGNGIFIRSQGKPGQSIPLLITGGDINVNNGNFGTNKISQNNDCDSTEKFSGKNYNFYCLKYSLFARKDNVNDSYLSNPHAYLNGNLYPTNKSEGLLSGFANFKTSPTADDSKYKIGNKNYLTSYYYRTLVGYDIGHIGGLGGFSGLGGKAGCGGLFDGNSIGYIKSKEIVVETFGTEEITTIIAPVTEYDLAGAQKLFLKNNGATAEISDYYDNCTKDTPNGQSANFVAPSPQKGTLGQAGAGGGGGGYQMFKGPGNGGNGQNGYLMIDWRK